MRSLLPREILTFLAIATFFALASRLLAEDTSEPADQLPPGAVGRFLPQHFAIKPAYNGMYRVLLSPDGQTLVTRDLQQKIVVWDVDDHRTERLFEAHIATVAAMAISPDGKQLIAASADPKEDVVVWNLATGEQLHDIAGGALVLRFLNDGKSWMFANETRVGKVDTNNGKVIREWPPVRIPLAISPDGSLIASQRRLDDDKIVVLDATTGKDKHVLPGLTANPTAAIFSPDGKHLAVATRGEELLRIWHIEQQKVVQTLSGHESTIQDVDYSRDGRFIATAGWDKTVRVWEAETARQIVRLDGHHDRVVSVAFSPNSRRMASGSSGRVDQSALVWNVAAAIARPHFPPAEVNDPKLAQLWQLLGSEKAGDGYAAAGNFIAAPEVALAFIQAKLADKLKPAPREEILRLIDDLDADDFGTREKATQELIRLRVAADTLLRKARETAEAAETKFRIAQILEAETPPSELTADQWRRMRRLIFALETIAIEGNDEKTSQSASALLNDLSTGHVDVKVIREAAAAAQRVDQGLP